VISCTVAAVEKAMAFLERDELPPHWDRHVLFGNQDDDDDDADNDSEVEVINHMHAYAFLM
jgi:hypothetical protein